MRIALAHDWLCGYRGGEAVLERLAALVRRQHEAAGLYVMVDDGERLGAAIDTIPHVRSRLDPLPMAAGRLRRWYFPLYAWAVEGLSNQLERAHAIRPIDLVISTSSAAIKGLRPPTGVPHLCYCHSPARYAWSQRREYSSGRLGGLRGAGLAMFARRFQKWDVATAANVTRFVANSGHTAAEIKRCYGRDAEIVHPPVRCEYFTPDVSVAREDFWLVVSALEPYKRVELAIEAARRAGKRLVVAGSGSQRRYLQSLSRGSRPGSVVFVDRVPDDELRQFYRKAAVLVFPQVEDFGIIAVEAMACGLPVVARRAGGALSTIVDGVTGALFDRDDPAAVVEAMSRLPSSAAGACRVQAARFSERVFDERMSLIISQALGGSLAIQPAGLPVSRPSRRAPAQ
ncbi:MAG: glycosyltransferase [Phycisphaerales bacterium]|nr:glycosyltransferase [Phycisphaerales bacterium]